MAYQNWSKDDTEIEPLTQPLTSNPVKIYLKKSDSFVIEDSLWKEAYIVFTYALQMSLSLIFEMGVQTILIAFLGHLPDSQHILPAAGMALSFANMSAIGFSWGFSSGLWTLIPQAVGSNELHLIPLYVQRATFVCFVVELPLSFILIYAGDIVCFIGSAVDLCKDIPSDIITNFCRALLPFPYLMVLLAVLQRIGQNLNYNFELCVIIGINFFISIPLFYLFVNVFDFGYIGCVMVLNLFMVFSVIMHVLFLMWKGYGFIFTPLPLTQICDKKGLKEYIYLSLPGTLQATLQWIIREIIIMLSGFIANPDTAVSVTVVLCNLNVIRMFHAGVANGAAIRVGAYIGANSIFHAKRCVKIQILFEMILTVIISMVFINFSRELPSILSDKKEVIDIASDLMYVLLLTQICAYGIYKQFDAVFRALGYQKISAYIDSVIQYFVILPAQMYLLFSKKYDYSDDTQTGLWILWMVQCIGFALADIVLISLFFYYLDWEKAVQDCNKRLNKKKSTGH